MIKEESGFREYCRSAEPQDLEEITMLRLSSAMRMKADEFLRVLKSNGNTFLTAIAEAPTGNIDPLNEIFVKAAARHNIILRIFDFSPMLANVAGDLIVWQKEKVAFVNYSSRHSGLLAGAAIVYLVSHSEENEGKELDITAFL